MLGDTEQEPGPERCAGRVRGAAVTALQSTSVPSLGQREGKTTFCNFVKEECVI